VPPEGSELDLDPRDWEETRQLGHRMVDDMLAHLRGLRERPAWQPVPPATRAAFRAPLPRAGQGAESAYQDFRRHVLPYPVGNNHPRFWGWAQGAGNVTGALAELLAASLNSMCWGGDQAGIHVEEQVLDWMKELLGFPAESSGIVVSGTSVATLIALAAARRKHGARDAEEAGLNQSAGALRIYCSVDTHNCLARAAALLGLGRGNVVQIPVDSQHRIDLPQLQSRIRADRGQGHVPMFVVGSAGTVGTGAIDPLDRLADLCREEGLWFHVDGAIGAVAMCSPALAPLFRGMERADSIAFDFHKWLSIPYEAGCVLIRDAELHRSAFANPAHYLSVLEGGVTPASATYFNGLGVELSRGMKALKVWMTLKDHGVERLGRVMEQNVEQTRYLADRLREIPEVELLGTGPLNIVCFRYAPAGRAPEEQDRLNQELLVRIQESGVAVPSPYVSGERFGMRICICGHRTRTADLDLFLAELGKMIEETSRNTRL
jgi:aromatic-L-amino-acid/L-tryptophan decarboxylase